MDKILLPPQEFYSPASTHHALVVTMGSPYYYWCKIGKDIRERLLVPGSMNLVPAGQPRISRWDRPADVLCINLTPELLEQTAQSLLADPDHIEFTDTFSFHDPQIENICRALLAELEQGAPSGRLFGEYLTTALVARLLHKYTAFPPALSSRPDTLCRVALRRTLEYIHANLGSDISLQQLAAVAGYSPTYFTSLFKRSTGKTPHQYVIEQRVEKAKELLRTGNLSIAEVAALVGFYDQSHLNRHFKRLTGTTPRALSAKS